MKPLYRDPFQWLSHQLKEAQNQGEVEPTAMSLATVGADGAPDLRVVLFKGFYNKGLTFYTNYESAKARQLDINPRATLNFYWPRLFQQARIAGVVEKLPREQSEAYFATRPRLSQLGAWSSRQSQKISSYQELMEQLHQMEQRFPDKVPCPPFWGGYVLYPQRWEFWLGRDGRLHERYVFEAATPPISGSSGEPWDIFMLSP